MTEQFDPYYQWLGIRPEEQPPDHYQLLGLQRFEDSPETIQHAADRQTAHLRTMQTGEHAELSKKLLDEVAAAKQCLLIPEKKATYDALLRGETEEPAFDESLITESWLHTTPLSRDLQRKKESRNQWPSRRVAIIGGVCAVTLLVVGVLWFGHQGSTETASPRNPIVGGNAAARPASPKPSRLPERPVDAPPRPEPKPDAPVSSSPPSTLAPVHENEVARTTVPEKKLAPPEVAKVVPAKKVLPKSSPANNAKIASRPEKPKEKLPVPSQAVQNEIIAQINELYKDAKTSAEKTKFARQLMNMAEASQKPEERFVIRRKAAELASDAGQLALMRKAIESIAAEYKIDALMVEAKMFDRQATTDGGDELIRRAIAEDRFDVATSVVNRLCQKVPARDRKEARRKQAEVERLRQQWLDAIVALKTLEAAPDDPLASLTAGRWLWFQKGDVRQGVSHLAKGSDQLLKRLAQRELTEQPTDSDPQLKLADAWWELAQGRKGEEKDYFMLHAAEWYEEVNPTLPGGLTKVRVEKRLEDVAVVKRSLAKSLTPLPVGARLKAGSPLPPGRWTDLLALVDAKRDGTGGHWERNGNALLTKQAVKNATLPLPVTVEGDYDLETQLTRTTGSDTVAIVFLVGANPCLLTLSESSGRTSRLGVNPNVSPPRQGNRIGVEPSVLTNGQKYAVLVSIRLHGDEASIQVCLDGVPHLSWSGKQNAVSVEGWPAKQMALGTHEAVTFHSVRLRPISGKATLTAAPDKR